MENYPQWNLPKEAKMRLGKGGMGGIQFSPDGTQIAVHSSVGVWLYDVETGKEISLIPEISGTLAFSSDGRFLKSEKGVWEIATGRNVSHHDTLPGVDVAGFLKDRKTFVSMGKARDTISILNTETGQMTTTVIGERPGYAHLENYALTEDKIAIGSRDGRLELWDIRTGKKLSTLREQTEKTINFRIGVSAENHSISLAFTPDGVKLASGNLDGTVQVWDTITGKELIFLNKSMDKMKMLFHSPDGKLHTHEPWEKNSPGRPTVLVFSPDGNLLAIGNINSSIQLWNIVTTELIASFAGHTSNVSRLAFSPDGNTLASGSSDGTVRFWSIETKAPRQTSITGHAWIRNASFIKDNSTLASVSSDGIVTAWDLKNHHKTTHKTKKTLEILRSWGSYVSLVLSPDGTKLLTHGLVHDSSDPNFDNYELRLTDVKTGRELAAFPDDNEKVFSPDGKTIAGSRGNTIYILNTESGEKLKIITSDHGENFDDDKSFVETVAFSPDGKNIVSGNEGGQFQMWDAETGVALTSFFKEQPSSGNGRTFPIRSFAFSSDGLLLAVRDRNKIRLLGRLKQIHFKEVSLDAKLFDDTLLFSPDNCVLVTSLYNGKIQLFDVSTGDILATLDGHTNMVEALTFSPDGKTLISVGGGTILFWDWEKVSTSARKEEQERNPDKDLHTTGQSTENVLKFLERSSLTVKSIKHALTLAEVYLANEWYEEALERYKRNLYITTSRTVPTPKGDLNVIASPKLERKLFRQITRASKNVKDIEGYANMLSQLIEFASDRPNIQLNSHIILAKFYAANGMLEKAEEHIQKTELITENIPTDSLEIRVNAYIALAECYREYGQPVKAEEYIQRTVFILENLHPDALQTKLNANFALAEYYREFGQFEKADEYVQRTGFITEDAWMVLGPFDNTDGIGYDRAYIPEDITEIDLTAKYDGLNGQVSWKKFSDDDLDGYIHLGEGDIDWHVAYAFTIVTSPDEREVEIRFDSDDQGKVWLNGKEVFSHTKTFMAIVDTYTIPVTLKPGKNSIFVKVCNEQGGWAFYMRITDSEGNPFSDLKFGNNEEK